MLPTKTLMANNAPSRGMSMIFEMSHVMKKAVTKITKQLEKKFGKLSVTRGKVHDYLGMTLDYKSPGEVKIVMTHYIDDIINEHPEEINGKVSTPAAENLFSVNEDADELDAESTEFFHTAVAKCLWISKRGRPDIQTAVSCLTTRVKQPNIVDWFKLRRLLKYLKATKDDVLTLSADNTNIIKWWADGAFAGLKDFTSQSGGTMSMGKGSVYSSSIKQKLNTKSSTESELVAADNNMPQLLWTKYFLEAQGHKINKSMLYQDNQSSMLLEKNGKSSSGKRTRHINVRYFFTKDRQDSGEVDIQYCPTEEMVADYFTKPLQGAKFRKFRKLIMNI